MNIRPMVYDSLTPSQRLIASIEAIARGDDAEHDKLLRTCPKKKYEQLDDHYVGMLQVVITTALQVELEMTADLLSLMLFIHRDDERANIFLQKIVNAYMAWNRQMEALGIEPQTIAKVVQKLRHPLLDLFLKTDPEDLPQPDEAAIKEHMDMWGALFKKILNT